MSIAELLAGFRAAQDAARDDEIRRMLGEWVSELEPVICYGPGGELLGLGLATPVGADGFIVIHARLLRFEFDFSDVPGFQS